MRTLLLVSVCLAAAGALAAAPAPQFAARMHRENGKTLPYRLLIPEGYTPDKAWPLVVWLHGSGEAGTDNAAQLKAILGTFLERCPAFVMAPQCPPNTGWSPVGINKAPEISDVTRMVVATIAELQKEFRIDDRRISIGGFSMGAYGVWEFIGRYPSLFAAAFPIAGSPAERVGLVPFIKEIPVWVFQGDKDGNAPVDGARKMVAALKAAGGNVKYTEYAGLGHDCSRAFAEPELPEWLFAQKRPAPAGFTAANLPDDAFIILKVLANGTRGTWTAAVHRTGHNVPRIVLDGTPYRLKPAAGAPPAVSALLERIGKGEVTGQCRVTGTVELSDRIWINVEAIEPAGGGKGQ